MTGRKLSKYFLLACVLVAYDFEPEKNHPQMSDKAGEVDQGCVPLG